MKPGDVCSLRHEVKGDRAQLERRMTVMPWPRMAGSIALTAALVKLL
ncbi:MAG: hypothetical protein JNK67_13920 [Alphaproteobacteria bacterium]|nr:hypothetical protein [Alphaproteobacteria bacterium]